jgi:hypothetical protein
MSLASGWLARGLRSPQSVNRLTESDSGPTVQGLLLPSQPALKRIIDQLLQRDAPLVGHSLSTLDQVRV